jgi:hypothetical protein
LETLKEKIIGHFFSDANLLNALKEVESAVENGEKSSFQGADELYYLFTQKKSSDGNGI